MINSNFSSTTHGSPPNQQSINFNYVNDVCMQFTSINTRIETRRVMIVANVLDNDALPYSEQLMPPSLTILNREINKISIRLHPA